MLLIETLYYWPVQQSIKLIMHKRLHNWGNIDFFLQNPLKKSLDRAFFFYYIIFHYQVRNQINSVHTCHIHIIVTVHPKRLSLFLGSLVPPFSFLLRCDINEAATLNYHYLFFFLLSKRKTESTKTIWYHTLECLRLWDCMFCWQFDNFDILL